jgi:hypothetical protein
MFLSYPGGMGYFGGASDGPKGTYFWELYPGREGDIERFANEVEAEARVVELLEK